MSLATLFPISLYLLVAYAASILIYAEGAALPTLFTIPFSFLAYHFSERRSVLVLPGWLANLLGLVALSFAALEFASDNPEGRLLSGAHLLVYLTWIVIFLQKNRHHYWWTIALSLLQVAVSSVLTFEPTFGLLLIIFAFLTIWTISLFSVFLAYQDELEVGDNPEASASGLSQRLNAHHIQSAKGTVLFGMPSRSIGGIEFDPKARWIGLRFGGRTMGITMICLVVGMTFFACIPRLWSNINPFTDEAIAGRSVTGFSENVRLGQMGEILTSNQPALSVKIFDQSTEEQLSMEVFLKSQRQDEPYFRGAVMDRYKEGVWQNSTKNSQNYKLDLDVPRDVYRHEYELEPLSSATLFVMLPIDAAYITNPKDLALFNDKTSAITRKQKRNAAERTSYVTYTRKNETSYEFLMEDQLRALNRGSLRDRFLQLPDTGLERVRELAYRVAEYSPEDPDFDPSRAVRRVIDHLQLSGEYKYSLRSDVFDSSIDPVEDFLFNRKEGHCEYYASSLTLMLRHLGIPARMVSGYKGGTQDSDTGAWNVQQRHAHAWVEANFNGKWNILDPTPAAQREATVQEAGKKSSFSLRALRDSLNNIWRKYVVGLSFNDQKRKISELFQDGGKSAAKGFWEGLKESASRLWEFVTNPSQWFSLRGGIVAFILMGVLVGFFFAARKALRWLRKWMSSRLEHHRRKRQVEFYERFLELCEKQKLRKDRAQTPREFAKVVSQNWNQKLEANGMQKMPADLIERFYTIRYGDAVLEPPEEKQLFESISRLEHLFSRNGKTHANLDTVSG